MRFLRLRQHHRHSVRCRRRIALHRGSDGTIRQWEPSTGKELRQFTNTTEPHPALLPKIDVALSPDGRMLAWADEADVLSASIVLCDTASGKQVRQLRLSGGVPHVLAFSPDGKTLAALPSDIWFLPGESRVALNTSHCQIPLTCRAAGGVFSNSSNVVNKTDGRVRFDEESIGAGNAVHAALLDHRKRKCKSFLRSLNSLRSVGLLHNCRTRPKSPSFDDEIGCTARNFIVDCVRILRFSAEDKAGEDDIEHAFGLR